MLLQRRPAWHCRHPARAVSARGAFSLVYTARTAPRLRWARLLLGVPSLADWEPSCRPPICRTHTATGPAAIPRSADQVWLRGCRSAWRACWRRRRARAGSAWSSSAAWRAWQTSCTARAAARRASRMRTTARSARPASSPFARYATTPGTRAPFRRAPAAPCEGFLKVEVEIRKVKTLFYPACAVRRRWGEGCGARAWFRGGRAVWARRAAAALASVGAGAEGARLL